MIDFLISKFVRNSGNISDPAVRRGYGAFAGIIGIIVNLGLSLAKITAGTLFGSISVTADGINNLSDAGSSVVTLIGFKLSGKPADRDHPFGHERIEYLTGFILGIVILIVGVELIKLSVNRIIYRADDKMQEFYREKSHPASRHRRRRRKKLTAAQGK